ncbi:multicopper oxidase domain-containing protein [Arthrobacter sp. JZ12]|uniref:multicopper oxidase family protein n=1 Tax=Arthrobacter sp. JZ12 TaxID=2654190 RepID=UPI002B4A12D8|nr:multicopper oxidase domain-containing protein [Arthrobacter sp. JZ12]WRH25879.1 multicopper oxidase domain-containing protein [Arthrobacter sp. JZ12]
MSITRRQLLSMGGFGALAAATLTVPVSTISAQDVPVLDGSKLKPYTQGFKRPPFLAPYKTDVSPVNGQPRNFYTVTQQSSTAEIVPGMKTRILGYNGIFPGPTISLDKGTEAVVTMRNQLPGKHPDFGTPLATSTHLHGSASLPQYDGYASDVTLPGFKKDYIYPNIQPARTLWYHDHGVHYTAQNAYSGLVAMYQIHDAVEKALLPQGEFDVPLMVSDIQLRADGNANYDDHSHSGLWGDINLVNGVPWPVMKVKRRIYRFRVLVCSISRSYRLKLSTGDPMTIVATDGGLMPKAVPVTSYRHANAERYEILIDFSKYRAGQRVELQNLSNKNNIDYAHTGRVMAFDVIDEAFDRNDPTALTMPTVLADSVPMQLTPSQSKATRRMRVERSNGEWKINDRSWADVIASNFQQVFANPGLNDVEIWEIENKSGGWFHPLHIHLVDFRILSRNGRAPFAYEQGPKDVIYVGENETVRAIMKFEHHKGRYMVHCHNLPHEDHDMMVQFRVGLKAGEADPNDPINAARPVWDTPAPQ